MPFKKEKKPGKRDSLNENKNNEQIQAQEGGERIVGRVSNAEMIELLSPGVNNNNSNELLDQRDSGPRADSPAKLEDIVRKAVKGTETTKEKIRWLENSLGNIALICGMWQEKYEEKVRKRKRKHFRKTLTEALDELEGVRSKKTFQRNKEEIESSLNAIEEVLDQYEGVVSEVKEVRTQIAVCKELLPIWAEWKDRIMETHKIVMCLYVMNHKIETIEAEAKAETKAEAEIEQFKELPWNKRRRKIGSLLDLLNHGHHIAMFVQPEIFNSFLNKRNEFNAYTRAFEPDAMAVSDHEFAEFMSEEMIPYFRNHGNRKDLIVLCERIANLLKVDCTLLKLEKGII